MMERKEDQFVSEVEKLKKIVQNNETIQEEVTKNINSVEDELSQVEVLMKGMKSDILQFRYALDGMTEYSNQLEIINDYCTALTRNSKKIEAGALRRNPKEYLEALVEIYTAIEYITNHPSLKERARLIEVQNNVIKRLVEECTTVLAQLLKGERIAYVPCVTNEVDPEVKEDLFEEFFGISPANLIILKDISSTLMKCGKYGFMNDCRTFMTMFLKRTIRGVIEDVKKHNLNKPNMEIMAHVYYHVLMYMEIEFLLTIELFGAENLQFAKIMAESLSLFISQLKDSLAEVQSLLNRPITETTDVTSYISELCGNVTSCALFVEFIGKDEPRYQRLFTYQGESPVLGEWNKMIQEVQSDCGQLMRLILEMIGRNNEKMNDEATISNITTSIINYLRMIGHYSDKLNSLALRSFTSPDAVVMADPSLTCYQRYTATVLLSLYQFLVRSTQSSFDIFKNHLYLFNNFHYISEALESGGIDTGDFIPRFFQRVFDEEYSTYLSQTWQRLTELAKDRIDPPFNGKAIQQEHRRYIKKIFAEFNSIYEQLVPSEFFVDVPDATVKAEILQAAEAMLAEYQVMWNQYSALPFSLHHRKRYLLHKPEEVENEIRTLFSRPV
ncbi:hypothetical protein WA171_003469 [Blastocystis sp. BT1]